MIDCESSFNGVNLKSEMLLNKFKQLTLVSSNFPRHFNPNHRVLEKGLLATGSFFPAKVKYQQKFSSGFNPEHELIQSYFFFQNFMPQDIFQR